MRLTCCYSGVSFYSSGFNKKKLGLISRDLNNNRLSEVAHPIMNVSQRFLLENVKEDWDKGTLDDTEQRLLFIALLKTTEHFIFRVPAIPSKQTILKNMELLIRTTDWKHAAGDRIRVPKYIVTPHTCRLTNIRDVLLSWGEARKFWEERNEFDKLRDRLYAREDALKRFFLNERSVEGRIKRLNKLSDWLMDAIRAPDAKRKLWTDIFNLHEQDDEKKIWRLSRDDIVELLRCMTENLEAGQWMANLAFKHIRELLKVNNGGMEFHLGMMEEDAYEAFSEDDIVNADVDEDGNTILSVTEKHLKYAETPFKILSDGRSTSALPSLEVMYDSKGNKGYVRQPMSEEEKQRRDAEANRRIIIANAPLEEPKKEDFPTGFLYLRSYGAWRMAKRDKEEQEKRRNSSSLLNSEKVLDSAVKEEDTAQSSSEVSSEVSEGEENVVSFVRPAQKGVSHHE